MAVTAIIPNADAAPPIVNATILPLLFISDVFIPLRDDAPVFVQRLANVFPVKHFVEATRGVDLPDAGRGDPPGPDLLIVAAWGVAGLLLAFRTFSVGAAEVVTTARPRGPSGPPARGCRRGAG